jgi:hypothetical protein
MQFSPRCVSFHRKLYRNRCLAVTLTAMLLLALASSMAQGPLQRYGHKPPSTKGPRAIGLVQLTPKGKARLTPIAIMMDGKFYDAGSYKAAPVPMALDFGVVYEGFRTGVSQGFFTITQPGQLNHNWIAEGTWLPAGMKDPTASKKYSTPVIEDKDAPPVLHRHHDDSDSPASKNDKAKKDDADKSKTKDDKDGKDAKDQKDKESDKRQPAATPSSGAPNASSPSDKTPSMADAKTPPSDENIADPNRPTLRRGKPDATVKRDVYATFEPLVAQTPATTAVAGKSDAKGLPDPAALPQVTYVPAISDAAGPDSRPYNYDVKPAEEAVYRNKMFDLAAAQLRSASNANVTARGTATARSNTKPSGKQLKPVFDDAILRIFDLSNSNQPVLILSAKIHPPSGSAENLDRKNLDQREITLIARTNLDGDVQKLFFSQTDAKHLDVTPRMELIDAVDADGDGRGELLFRRTSDSGSAFSIYRVTNDNLFPLFEGTL